MTEEKAKATHIIHPSPSQQEEGGPFTDSLTRRGLLKLALVSLLIKLHTD